MKVLISKYDELFYNDDEEDIETENFSPEQLKLIVKDLPPESTYSGIFNNGDSQSYVIVQKYYKPLSRKSEISISRNNK